MSGEHREVTHSIEAYSALSHPLRRRVLFELSTQPNPVSLDVLAEALTHTEPPDVDEFQGAPTDAEAVATSLHHKHLPKLADMGWIQYNDEVGTVRYQSHVEQIQADLRDISDELASLRAALDAETMGRFPHGGNRRWSADE